MKSFAKRLKQSQQDRESRSRRIVLLPPPLTAADVIHSVNVTISSRTGICQMEPQQPSKTAEFTAKQKVDGTTLKVTRKWVPSQRRWEKV